MEELLLLLLQMHLHFLVWNQMRSILVIPTLELLLSLPPYFKLL